MKPIYAQAAGAVALTFVIASCAQTPAPAPAPAPVVTPPTVTASPVPTMPSVSNWADAPQTPGDWTYRATNGGSIALFGEPQQGVRFSIECSLTSRAVFLARATNGDSSTDMTIRTETSDRTVATVSEPDRAVANLASRDPLLDAMALTRGRFAVEIPGLAPLYLPAWAEVTRVIEDCR